MQHSIPERKRHSAKPLVGMHFVNNVGGHQRYWSTHRYVHKVLQFYLIRNLSQDFSLFIFEMNFNYLLLHLMFDLIKTNKIW
jgi:hypothetical protein